MDFRVRSFRNRFLSRIRNLFLGSSLRRLKHGTTVTPKSDRYSYRLLVQAPRCFEEFPEEGYNLSRIKTALIVASMLDSLGIGEAAIKTQQSAGRSIQDLASAEESFDLPLDLRILRGRTAEPGYHTPLSLAADHGCENMVKFMLNHDENPDGHENMRVSPLMYAARKGNESIIDILLQQRNALGQRICDANFKTIRGLTALTYAAMAGQLRAVKLLLELGADPEIQDDCKDTALVYAIKYDRTAVAKFLILEQKVQCDGPNDVGATPLLSAIDADNIEIARDLLDSGADSKTEDKYEVSLLSNAALLGHLRMLRLLLDYGADIESGGRTQNCTPLIHATETGDLNVVKFLLDAGANLNVEASDGTSPLSHAAVAGNLDMIQLLYEHGSDPERENRYGERALVFAVRGGSAVVAFLLQKLGVEVNTQNCSGNTPLAVAIMHGNLKAAMLLLKAGANTELANNHGRTPLWYAVQRSRPYLNIVQLLLKYGANPEAEDEDGTTPLWYAENLENLKKLKVS